MTRMVEAQRTQIGTLKALGYTQGNIKYMYQFYTWLVGMLGGAIGVVAGLFVFPGIVYGAYRTMYPLGAFTLKIESLSCLIGLFCGVVAISVATSVACRHTVKDKVDVLLRPKAPRPGKRVLLERIPFLWRRLPFGVKVTLRNLFRYKNRFFMTVLGVTGCAALLLTGFGLRDSISGLIDAQFEDITHYETTIMLKEGSGAAAKTALNTKLSGDDAAYVHVADSDASAGDRTNTGFITYLYVPEDPEGLNRFLTFRERVGHAPIAFPPDQQSSPSAVISERLATVLDLRIGDTMRFTPTGMEQTEVRVSGVTENYIYNYIYITPADYQALFGESPTYSSVIVDSDLPQEDFDALVADLLGLDDVASAVNVSQAREISKIMVDNLSAIVWTIIFVACLLALIVLYNLVNINITERERELATLKVLGFSRYEVDAYISRETTILTVLGAAVGLAVGIFLHRYVMVSIEVNEVMFSRTILPQSYLYAAAFTLGCGFLIRLAMRPRLNKIDPVSSLKSVD
jgi:putative ABC transport system permease protein